ncbi:MAG: TonB-dependent receptor plug domain-containing protein [Rhodospirillaceae bacterium]
MCRIDSLLALALMVAMTAAQPALSQDSSDEGTGVIEDGARTIYGEAYFKPFNAVIVEDVLRRIPGIQDVVSDAQSVSTQRGFGSSGAQILFNGRRLSGKSMTVGSALQRIQVSQLLQVEVIRGTVAGLDVRSEGTLVNIVLKEELTSGSGTLEGSWTNFTGVRARPGGIISYSGDFGPLNYALSLEAEPSFFGRDRFGLFYRTDVRGSGIPNTQPFQILYENPRNVGTDIIAAGSLTYVFDGGNILNLNGRYADQGRTDTFTTERFDILSGIEISNGSLFNIRTRSIKNWELGGDYEHIFSGGDTLKVLAIYTNSSEKDARDFFSTPVGGAEVLTRKQQQLPDRVEKILRGTYRTQLSQGHSLEAGAEVALNSVNSFIELFNVNNSVETNVPLFNPDGSVKETRFESFLTYSWQATPSFLIEGATDTEYSRLTQSGSEINTQRSFFFVKPRVDARLDYGARAQVRARVQRSISQLNFADFISGFNTDFLRLEVLRAGNPDLVPEKEWLYELTHEYRLPDDQGVITLRGFYKDISSHIEQIPIGQGVVSATGNNGSARHYGSELSTALRLGWIGLPTARLDANFIVQDSRVTDPFTGEKRNLSGIPVTKWSVDYRYDTSWNNFSYGLTIDNRGESVLAYPTNILDYNPKVNMDGFFELQIFGGVTLRFDAERVLKQGARGERYIADGRRGVSPITALRLVKSVFPRKYKVSLRGTF